MSEAHQGGHVSLQGFQLGRQLMHLLFQLPPQVKCSRFALLRQQAKLWLFSSIFGS